MSGIVVIVVEIKTVTINAQLKSRYIVIIYYYSGFVFGFVDYYCETIKIVWCSYYIMFCCKGHYLHQMTFILFICFIRSISITNYEFKIFDFKYLSITYLNSNSLYDKI